MTVAHERVTRSVGSGPRLALSTACLSGTLEDKLSAAAAAGFSTIELLANDLVMAAWTPREVRAEAARLGMSIEAYQPLHVEAVPPSCSRSDCAAPSGSSSWFASWAPGCWCSARRCPRTESTTTTWRRPSSTPWRNGPRPTVYVSPTNPFPGGGSPPTSTPHAWSTPSTTRTWGCASTASTSSRETTTRPRSRTCPPPRSSTSNWLMRLGRTCRTGRGACITVPSRVRVRSTSSASCAACWLRTTSGRSPSRSSTTSTSRKTRATPPPGPCAHAGPLRGRVLRQNAGDAGLFNVRLRPRPRSAASRSWSSPSTTSRAPVITRALASLGFAAIGQHRSKPVQLWQQGGARVLVNLAPQRAIAPATAALCALGVETPDPAGFASRAGSLLPLSLSGCVPPTSPSSNVSLLRTGPRCSSATRSRRGLAPRLREPGGADRHRHTRDSDRSRLPHRVDRRLRPDRALLPQCARARVGADREATAPFGQVRTWAAATPRAGSGSVSARHRCDAVTGLRWSRARTTSRSPSTTSWPARGRCAGRTCLAEDPVELLRRPGRELRPAVRAARCDARALDPLRPRRRGGEFLHFFTEMLGSRVFFSVVQRIGDYQSSGRRTAWQCAWRRTDGSG